MNWDYATLDYLNSWLGHSKVFDTLAYFLANDLVYIFVLVLIVYWFVGRPRVTARKSLLIAATAFVICEFVLVRLIRALWPRPRPWLSDSVLHAAAHITQPSFPSGHAAGMFVIAAVIFFYDRRFGWLLYAMALTTGIFRVVIGVHYPTDIIGGAVLGVLTGWLCQSTLQISAKPIAQKLSHLSDNLFRS